jgi:hypothetical protein
VLFPDETLVIADHFDPAANAVLYQGDCLELLATLPPGSQKLIVTSPPYNIGKVYEKHQKLTLDDYLEDQRRTISVVTLSCGATCATVNIACPLYPALDLCWLDRPMYDES